MTYLLRAIDPKLWKAVKNLAAADGHSIRWVILRLLENYVENGLP